MGMNRERLYRRGAEAQRKATQRKARQADFFDFLCKSFAPLRLCGEIFEFFSRQGKTSSRTA
jgi:hypothetical protein